MIEVFILIIYLQQGRGGGPTLIDNISTAQECERVGKEITRSPSEWGYKGVFAGSEYKCIKVQKVK